MTSSVEEQVRQAMRAAAGGIEPPVRELVEGGLARGRRMRRRHRIGTIAGGVVTVGAVAIGAASFTPHLLTDNTVDELSTVTAGASEADRDLAEKLAELEGEKAQANEEAMPRLESDTETLAADLGPGWTAHTEPGVDLATPTGERRKGLPEGYEYPTVVRDVGDEIHCEAGQEKGTQVDACVHVLTSDMELVSVRWGRTLIDHPSMNNAGAPVQDDLWVIYEQDDGSVVTVRLWVAEPIEQSTPARRAAATQWMRQQLDALIAAATVGDLQRSNP